MKTANPVLYFEQQALGNKWLNQLTETERQHIIDMLTDFNQFSDAPKGAEEDLREINECIRGIMDYKKVDTNTPAMNIILERSNVDGLCYFIERVEDNLWITDIPKAGYTNDAQKAKKWLLKKDAEDFLLTTGLEFKHVVSEHEFVSSLSSSKTEVLTDEQIENEAEDFELKEGYSDFEIGAMWARDYINNKTNQTNLKYEKTI